MAFQLLKPLLGNGRSFSSSALRMTINNVTVIGGGTMGAGIAQVLTINTLQEYSAHYFLDF